MTFLDQPIIYPQSITAQARRRFQKLVVRAKAAATHDESLRCLVMGDSTSTVPGQGANFAHWMHNKIGGLFGNVPGTGLLSARGTDIFYPFGIVSGNNPRDPGFASNQYPPQLLAGGFPFGTGEGSFQPTLIHAFYNARFPDIREAAYQSPMFPNSNLRVEFEPLKNLASVSELKVLFAPFNTRHANLFITPTSTEVVDLGDVQVDNGGAIEFAPRVRTSPVTPPADYDAQWYIQSNAATVDPADPPYVMGMRILNENPVGAMWDFFSIGGYTVAHIMGDTLTGSAALHRNSAPAICQCRHDIAFFSFGANDLFGSTTAASVRRNYYDVDGTNNRGLVGELIAEYESRGIPVPLLVFVDPPFRSRDDDGAWTSAKLAQHEALASELIGLVDELQANGYDAIFLNVHRYTWERGLNDKINELNGLTDRGTYSTSSVSYVVGDYYLGATSGDLYRCVFAHTSSATTEPDEGADKSGFHAPLKTHLVDEVHRTKAGASIEADAYLHLFSQHFGEYVDFSVAERQLGVSATKWHEDYARADQGLG